MYTAQGKFCFLKELTTENDKELFELMKNNKEEYRFLISDGLYQKHTKNFKKD
jgi:hypothetical protein